MKQIVDDKFAIVFKKLHPISANDNSCLKAYAMTLKAYSSRYRNFIKKLSQIDFSLRIYFHVQRHSWLFSHAFSLNMNTQWSGKQKRNFSFPVFSFSTPSICKRVSNSHFSAPLFLVNSTLPEDLIRAWQNYDTFLPFMLDGGKQ